MFNKKTVKPSKHQASKKGFRHQHNLSKGQLNALKNKKSHTVGDILTLKQHGIELI